MSNTLTTDLVWKTMEKELFGILGMVTAKNEARTVGIVYVVRGRKLYVGTGRDTWKTRHIQQNPNVSLTIPIHKSIPFLPWIKIPSATITFSGKAQVKDLDDVPADILDVVYRGMEIDDSFKAESVVIEIEPIKDFVTYGVGVSLMDMRDPKKARGRVAVA
jgi:uncharacterized pyridoxamine 5'-phosphate oxidase family protein